jgi:hypothetical protein
MASTPDAFSNSTGVPPARDSWADALEEARELRGLSFEQRYALLQSACRLVFQILENHPDRERILAYREPPRFER